MGCCPGKSDYPQPVGPVPLLCRGFLVWDCCPGKRDYPQPVGSVPLLCREFLVWVAVQVRETIHSPLVLSLYCAVSSWYGLLPR